MTSFLEQIDHLICQSDTLCLATLVEVQGSMPQKPGVTMLIRPDGMTLGSIGGGSAEQDIIRAGSNELASASSDSRDQRHSRVVTLTRQHAPAEAGLHCGDQMSVLLETITPRDDLSYFRQLRTKLADSNGVTEAIVLDKHSANGEPGDRYLFDETGRLIASFCLRPPDAPLDLDRVRKSLKPPSTRPSSYSTEGMLFIPRLKQIRLVLVGAGHVSQKVAELARDVDFDVWVVDDRPEYCHATRFLRAQRLIVSKIDDAIPELAIDSNTYCLILNRTHEGDERTLRLFIDSSAAYLGLIGSRRKIQRIFNDLATEGMTREQLRNVHAPVGINIGSRTINEIAISIVAELIAHRNLGKVPNRTTIFDSESKE